VPTIVTLGKATEDMFVTSVAHFVPQLGPGGRVLTLPLGGKVDLDDVVVTSGGNAANAATTFARQGLTSVFLWAFGDDESSGSVIASLEEEGVDISHVVVEPGRTVSLSVILLSRSGERVILNHRGSPPSAGRRRIDLAPIAEADWLYVSSLAGDLGLLADALSVATAAGTRVLLNPAGTELQQRPSLLSLVPRCDILAMNADEARLLLGTHEREPRALAGAVAALGPNALITDGARGAVYCDRRRVVTAPTAQAPLVVDTTGCGDAFASGFLCRLAQGAAVDECLRFAAANAASVLQHLGARAGILRPGDPVGDLPVTVEPVAPVGRRPAAGLLRGRRAIAPKRRV
jgi:sugar/nucleoside kinase (ribokinase family)